MKHVCVAARTVDNAKRGEADIANISKPRDKVSRAGRSRIPIIHDWMRPRNGTQARHHARDSSHAYAVASPQAGSLLRASARWPFWLQPEGLARLFAQLCVLLLGNIRDIAVVALLDLSENRDSASRVSLC
jgi:hypothetical protein